MEVNSWNDFEIEAWNVSDKRLTKSWSTKQSVLYARWSLDNRRLALAGAGQEGDGGYLAPAGWIYVFDAQTGETIHKLRHGSEGVPACSVVWDATRGYAYEDIRIKAKKEKEPSVNRAEASKAVTSNK